MIDIEKWTSEFCAALENTFRNRVLFIGLQGSYSRGEATDKSDIDMVVILDKLDYSDVQRYSDMLDTLTHRELCCGFLSCREDLAKWDVPDLFQLFHDTAALRGDLGSLIPEITDEDVVRAIKTGLCSIYHICVHNSLYGRKERTLKNLYKSASFVIQAIVYRETGEFVRTQRELLERAGDSEKPIISEFIRLKKGGEADLAALSELLFDWVRYRLNDLG
ncbi:MAG: nucleotidyltransferase domain-containing protein [Ruminococcus sp.]|nr:nucleotidyltransferase domain-containing protein [Ruminococcus sp.]